MSTQFSCAHLEAGEETKQTFRLPSPEHQRLVDKQSAADPEMRPYFFQQAPDYLALKACFLEHILASSVVV